ncbi:ATP-binding cassette domain-containing protein [Nocardia sp. CA-084685]|uniref:ATP-binding cassette domain-containing protein n=1 Tax=Nocardia sp. CA-084685 TaxID=3239970 RepID=UPI003D97AE79
MPRRRRGRREVGGPAAPQRFPRRGHHLRHGCGGNDAAQLTTNPDIAIRGGEFVSLVDPSGCGKSTLLRLAAGFERATAGTVDVAAAQLGYVFQESTLLHGPPITAAGNANPVKVQLAEKIVGNGTDDTLGNFDTARVDRVITSVTDTLRGRGQQVSDGVTAADLVTNQFIDPAIGLRAQ